MKKLDHINIVKLHETISMNDYEYIILEYCEGGSLKDFL